MYVILLLYFIRFPPRALFDLPLRTLFPWPPIPLIAGMKRTRVHLEKAHLIVYDCTVHNKPRD